MDTAQTLRAFEDTLRTTMQTWVPERALVIGCIIKGADGEDVCLAQYEVQPDGTFTRVDEEEDDDA
jgi:hypothetical protein